MRTEKTKQDLYQSLGKDYFWFFGHYALAKFLLKRFWKGGKGFLLNIGCGPKEFSIPLPGIKMINADYSFDACRHSSKVNQDAVHVCCDAEHLPFKNGSLDIIVGLEILEHLQNDQTAGIEFGRALKLEGFSLVSVPAYQFLWGSHDELNKHYKRYTLNDLKLFASQKDMTINYFTYYKILFVLPLLIMRRIKKLFRGNIASSDFVPISPFTNYFLKQLLYIEALIASAVPIPAGVSLFAVIKNRITN